MQHAESFAKTLVNSLICAGYITAHCPNSGTIFVESKKGTQLGEITYWQNDRGVFANIRKGSRKVTRITKVTLAIFQESFEFFRQANRL